MLHGEGGRLEDASHREGSGLEKSPISNMPHDQFSPIFHCHVSYPDAQVLKLKSSTSSRIQQSGIFRHFLVLKM